MAFGSHSGRTSEASCVTSRSADERSRQPEAAQRRKTDTQTNKQTNRQTNASQKQTDTNHRRPRRAARVEAAADRGGTAGNLRPRAERCGGARASAAHACAGRAQAESRRRCGRVAGSAPNALEHQRRSQQLTARTAANRHELRIGASRKGTDRRFGTLGRAGVPLR